MWIYVPKSCPSAQESEALTSESSWLFQELERSVSWRGKQRASKSWYRAWKRGGWLPRLCGRMSRPSTAQRGVDEWILSLPATRASRSVSQARASETKTQGTSGRTLPESSEKCSQLLLFSKMSKDMSSEGSTKSSTICTNWGSMLNGEFTQLPKPVLPTGGTGCSSWPTPTAVVSNDGESVESFLARQKKWAHKYHNSVPLTIKAKSWATPTARDHKDGTNPSEKAPTNSLPGRQAPRVTGQISQSTSGQRLNPLFVEWLMGFPPGWISFELSAMPLSPTRQPSRSETSSGGSLETS